MRLFFFFLFCISLTACQPSTPLEKDGFVMVEAEQFYRQSANAVRTWVRVNGTTIWQLDAGDPDSLHVATASRRTYLEALPDTRTTHDDELIPGENFSNEPGKIAILEYPVRFTNPGRYYVWVRAFSTGTEDNGIHVGLNGTWPESGRRMQWCEGKNQWQWASKQRTEEVHCGVEKLIFLDIPTAGLHTIAFSMREDGFEFDRFALSKAYQSPDVRP